MDDLVSRLLEAIGEVERKAQRIAEQDEWDESPHDRLRLVINDRYPAPLYDDDEPPRGPLLEVLSLADPSSFLRRCTADREFIADIQTDEHAVGKSWECGTYYSKPCDCGRDERVSQRLAIIARGYGLSDHQEGE